ncbi:MAG TPA: hypothetical protein VGE02_06890 [Gemmatimonadales bacterium]
MPHPLPVARTARPRAAARLVLSATLGALGALAGCAGASTPEPPGAEFVVAAGDTSVWVRTGPDAGSDGIEVRRAPITLTLLDGRFHELYVTEDDYSFHDALFAAQTVWRRDLVTGDSVIVHGDPTAPVLAIEYGHRHPDERPLEPEEEGAEEPAVMGVTEAWVVDVHGPFATVESFADLHPEGGESSHQVRLRVVDLRRGAELTLSDLLGDSVSAGVVARGRAAFAAARDSARATHARSDAAARRASVALGRFAFDERSFTLTSMRSGPGVVFHVPGTGGEADGHALPLAPITVPDGAWWREARDGMPVETTDGGVSVAVWSRGSLAVEARRERDGDRLVLRDSTGRAWRIASMAGAAQRVYWLDSRTGADDRAALARAFYEATLYDGTLRAVSHGARSRAMGEARPRTRLTTFRR